MNDKLIPTLDLARKLIAEQFPEFSHLPISEVEKQGHDNRTYRLGSDMLIRIPSDKEYATAVRMEHKILPLLASRLSVSIPVAIKMGIPSKSYPYPFSIYRWLEGKSINLLSLSSGEMDQLAFDLAKFLRALHKVTDVERLTPAQHSDRGNHVSIYDDEMRVQATVLQDIIDVEKAIALWERACATKWNKEPVWVHGDFAIGNILMQDGKLSAVIDFGSTTKGDPACDLVIAWTYLAGRAREIFIAEMDLDQDTWLRARAWALWKATFELCQIADKNIPEALLQILIIEEVMSA